MTRTRLPALAAAALLLLGAGLAGCSSDDSEPAPSGSTAGTSGSTADPSSFASDVDEALDAVGDDGLLEITAEQLDGTFGLEGYEIDGDRLTMFSEGSSDQAEAQCLQAGIVLEGVGSPALLSIRYADATVDCADFD